MRVRDFGLAVLSAAVALAVLGVSAASASVTIGNALQATSFGDAPCGAGCTSTDNLTMLQTVPATGARSYASPINGTIVRWRIQTAAGSSPGTTIWLRVMRNVTGNKFIGAGTGPPETLTTLEETQTFPVDLPIKAGDYIGLDQDSKSIFAAYGEAGSESGANFNEFVPQLNEGEEGEPAIQVLLAERLAAHQR